MFDHEPICPKCQEKMRIVQFVEDPQVIIKICDHLNLPTSLPPLSPARAPPQQEIDLDCFDIDDEADLDI